MRSNLNGTVTRICDFDADRRSTGIELQFAVAYQPEHFRFYCPRHRRKFSRTGKHLVRFGYEDTPPLQSICTIRPDLRPFLSAGAKLTVQGPPAAPAIAVSGR